MIGSYFGVFWSKQRKRKNFQRSQQTVYCTCMLLYNYDLSVTRFLPLINDVGVPQAGSLDTRPSYTVIKECKLKGKNTFLIKFFVEYTC